MLNFKKLLVASFVAMATMFIASTCAFAAQVDSLSIIDNTIYAQVTAENARFYVAEYKEGLLSDVFFSDIAIDGTVQLEINEASEYTLYVWDKDSLAPICSSYKIIDGRAYAEGSTTPVPEYEFSDYSFNQDDNVMIVSAVSEDAITGFKAGETVTYALTDSVTVLGLSDDFADVVPGSVVLIGTNRAGDCAAIELLATMGIPVDQAIFESDFGIHAASDGSEEYLNIVTEMFAKNSSVLTTFILDENGNKTPYYFVANAPCYRVGIAMDGETPVITCSPKKISAYPSIFERTDKYHNYLYLRFDTRLETVTSKNEPVYGMVTECVFYCVPKDFNPGKGDDEYTDIFSLEPIVIIE